MPVLGRVRELDRVRAMAVGCEVTSDSSLQNVPELFPCPPGSGGTVLQLGRVREIDLVRSVAALSGAMTVELGRVIEVDRVRRINPLSCPPAECPPNALQHVDAGIRLDQRLALSGLELAAGISVVKGTLLLHVPTDAGVVLTDRAEGQMQQHQESGVRLDQRFNLSGLIKESGAKLVQVSYDLTRFSGANAAVNDGPDNWTNPANAIGKRNDVAATRSGQVVALTDANLRLGYANFTDKTDLTITQVRLLYSTAQSGTVLNNGGLHHEYRLAPADPWTSLQVFTGNHDSTSPSASDPYNITAAVGGDWSKLDALEVRVRAVLGVGTLAVACSCDAVEVEVLADLVDVL